MKTTLNTVMTFVGSVAVGCGAAIAIASAAAVTHEAPSLRAVPLKSVQVGAPAEVIRLEPIVVTISSERFEAIRKQDAVDSQFASTNAKAKRNA